MKRMEEEGELHSFVDFFGVQLCVYAFFVCTMLELMFAVMQEMGQCSSILVSIVMETTPQWH
jgi:hypothetical protein